MVDILHRVGIRAPISKIYTAVATVDGVAGWWAQSTTGDSMQGGHIDVVFASPSGEQVGAMTMAVTALVIDREVHWRFIAGPPEWVGTDAVFQFQQDGEFTILLFSHKNWREAVEFTHHCSTKWAIFLMSLREFVETGEGRPAPNDIKIDNWN